MNRRMMLGLAVAVVVALIASSVVYQQIKRATVVKPMVTNQVVVAALALPLGTKLAPQHLRLIAWPAGDPLPGMLTRMEDCANRALITSVVENEPILEHKLAPQEAGAGLAATIPPGMRAVSVKVNEVVAVAGFVLPGTMVDVLVTGTAGGSDSVTRTILENVRVLAAGQRVEQDEQGKPQTVPVITLLVTPEEANQLTMASTEGRIQLALRNTIDTKKTEPPAVNRASLFRGATPGGPRKPAGVQPRSSVYVVEVIRGSKRESETFPTP